jgi:hypothetical protein
MRARARWVGSAGGIALLLAACWWWRGSDDAVLPAQLQASSSRASASNALDVLSAAAPVASVRRTPEAFEQWLTRHSSLRGVSLDGAWDVDRAGRLQPTLALRRRFDQLLSLVGETSLDQITAFVAHDVQETFGATAAAQVIDLWLRYLALQQHAFRTRADMNDRNTCSAARSRRPSMRMRMRSCRPCSVQLRSCPRPHRTPRSMAASWNPLRPSACAPKKHRGPIGSAASQMHARNTPHCRHAPSSRPCSATRRSSTTSRSISTRPSRGA